MKNIFKGFTLTELILCIGIISMITALGINIAKRSTNNAYKVYYRTGYQNLYDALQDAHENGRDGSLQELRNELRDIFGNTDAAENDNRIRTRNGVEYNILEANANADANSYIITMQVPQPKTRRLPNGSDTVILLYNNTGDGFLIPISEHRNRSDLFPFNVETGEAAQGDGGNAQGQAGNNNEYGGEYGGGFFKKKRAMTYRDAMCQAYGGSIYATLPTIKDINYSLETNNNGGSSAVGENWDFSSGTRYTVVDCGEGNNNPAEGAVVRFGY